MKITITTLLCLLLLVQPHSIVATQNFRGANNKDVNNDHSNNNNLLASTTKNTPPRRLGMDTSSATTKEKVEKEKKEDKKKKDTDQTPVVTDPNAPREGESNGVVGGLPDGGGGAAPPPQFYPLINDNGLREKKECAQPWSNYVQTINATYANFPANVKTQFKTYAGYEACFKNQCNSGCCRIHFTGTVCDTSNLFYEKQCVCNSRTYTKATPKPTNPNAPALPEKIPVPPVDPNEDRNTNEDPLARSFRTCAIFAFDNSRCDGTCPNGGCCVEYACQCRAAPRLGEKCVDPNEIGVIPDLGDGPGVVGGIPDIVGGPSSSSSLQHAASNAIVIDITTEDGSQIEIDLEPGVH